MGAAASDDVVVRVDDGRGGGEGRRHQGEDEVQRGAAEEGEAVDVAEVDLAAEEQEGAEEEEEQDGPGEVGVVHDVLVDAREGVQDRERLYSLHMTSTAVRELPLSFLFQNLYFSTARDDDVSGSLPIPRNGETERDGRTFPLICPKFTPNSSSSGGSPSYPSVPNAANHPVRRPPCSPIRPLTPPPGTPNPDPPKLEGPGPKLEDPVPKLCEEYAWFGGTP